MADRTVRVVLEAVVTQYRNAMKDAARDTAGLDKQVKASTDKTNASLRTLGTGLVIGGGALLAGFGAAVSASAKFEKQMSGVKAVANATAGEMKQLSDAALKAGADTVFSASDAAKAEAELAKAGISVSDILGGALTGSLSLAAAGQLDLADAATVSAQAMNVFKLEGSDVGHIADVLAAAANKSAADVKTLGDGLRQGGLVAAQTGLTLEETTGALAAFADNALVGSDAGTSLKTMLQRLTPQSAEAQQAMDSLGITAYDAQGNFIGLDKFAGKLHDGLANLTDQQKSSTLATIFGSDAVRAASILYDQGEAGIRDYIDSVNDQGAAARMAATQMDNLSGDVEALKGSFETALISSGSGANKVLREIVQTATSAVNVFNELPGPLKQTASGLLAVGGAAAVLGGAALIGVGQVGKFKAGMDALNVSTERQTKLLRGAGLAMKGLGAAGAAAALLGVVEQLNTAGAKQSQLPRITEGLVDLAQQGHLTGDALKVFGDDFDKLGKKIDVAGRGYWSSFTTGQKSIKNARQDLDDLDKALAGLLQQGRGDEAAAIFEDIEAAAKRQGVSTKDLQGTFNDYNDALANSRTQNKLAAGPTGDLTSKIEDQQKAAKDAAQAIRDQADAIRASVDPIFAAQDAYEKQADAQKELNKQIRAHGKNSKEAREAQAEVLKTTVDLDSAVANLSAGLKDGSVSLTDVNGRLDAYARAGLITTKQAAAFKSQLLNVSDAATTLSGHLETLNSKNPKPKINTAAVDAANRRVQVFEDRLERINGRHYNAYIDVTATLSSQGFQNKHEREGHAAGGYIVGPGTGTSDSIGVRVSNGEYIVNAAATREHRAMLDFINGGGTMRAASSVTNYGGSSVTYGDLNIYNPTPEPASNITSTMAMAAFLHGS